MGPEALWSPFCFSSLSSEQEEAQEALRECQAKVTGKMSTPPRNSHGGERDRERNEVFQSTGHPLGRHGQLHALPPSLLGVDCLVLRTGWPGRFRSG